MKDNDKVRTLIDIPADGNYIEILGHRIDGFESFEAFLEHLKKYAELEETVEAQKAEIEALTEFTKKSQQCIIEKNEVIDSQQAELERLKDKLNHSIGIDNTKENGCFPFD